MIKNNCFDYLEYFLSIVLQQLSATQRARRKHIRMMVWWQSHRDVERRILWTLFTSSSMCRNDHNYPDGGPDHGLTYLSVKLALTRLYLKFDLDYLCAARTAQYHLKYFNPVERIMSILNLGLQGKRRENTRWDGKVSKRLQQYEGAAQSCRGKATVQRRKHGFYSCCESNAHRRGFVVWS